MIFFLRIRMGNCIRCGWRLRRKVRGMSGRIRKTPEKNRGIKMRNRKFYRKLLLTYIGIVCVYTAIIIGLFFVGAKKYIQKRLDTKNQLFLEQYAKSVDTVLEMSFNVSKQMFSSNEVQTFLLAKEIDYYNVTMLYRSIHRTLSPFSHLNFFLAIGKSNSDIIISTNGTLQKEEFYRKMKFPFNGEEERRKYAQVEENVQGLSVFKTDGSFYNASESLITMIESQKLLGRIEMLSYLSYPEKGLFPDIEEWGGGALLVRAGEEALITRNYGIPQEKWERIYEQFMRAEIPKISPEYTLYHYTLSRGDWELNYIAKNPGFVEMWAEILAEFGWIYLGLAFFGAVAAFLISKRIYRPILSVVNQFQEDYNVSGADEFALIRTASEEMNRSKAELEQIIRENTKPLKTKFIRDLLYGLSDQDDIEEKKAKYDLAEMKGPFCLVLIEHVNYAKMGEQFSQQNLGEIRRHIAELYFEVLSQGDHRFELVELESKRLVILLSEKEYLRRREELEELTEGLEKDYGIQILAVLSKSAKGLEDLDESYHSVIGVLSYRNLLPRNKIVSYERGLEVKPMSYYYPLDIEESLMNYVDQRKEEETHLLLEHILNQNFRGHEMSGENISLLIFAIIATINRLLNQQLKAVEDVYGEGTILYLELKMLTTEESFREKVHSLFQILLEKLEDESHPYQEDSLAARLLEYIHANYQTDISLNDVAEAFSITPTYVSMLFKKEYRTNFKDYLNRYKIEQAKEMIKKNPNIKNKELSEAVGFNSVNTFLRLFKKYTGETPGRYMESKR